MSPHRHPRPDAAGAYRRLAAMAVLSFACMYLLMYAMVDRLADVYANLNQFYMAALMAAPMVLIELALMGAMYPSGRRKVAWTAGSAAVLVLCWVMIRRQIGIEDRQFLRSMIPHHSGAILMCRQAPVDRPDIRQLCMRIIASQQEEIDEMQRMLATTPTVAP